MPTVNLPFDLSEYEARLAKVRASMAGRGLETLVISDPSNMGWLTGYDGWSFYVHQAVIVSAKAGTAPVWWGRAMDALGAKRTVWMGEDDITSYDDTFVQNPDKHPMQRLGELLIDRGWAGGPVGVELDNYYYSAAAHQSLTKHLGSARVEDATGLVNWCRAVKSDTEIEYMTRAARIVESMHKTIADLAGPGVPKHFLVAEITKAGIQGADGYWGDYPAIVPLAPSGMDATAPHLTWDDTPMRMNETTFFEIAGVYRRYHCPQSRTIYLGEPSVKYRRAEEAVLRGIEAGLAKAKPGNTCEDLAIAFYTELEKHGFRKEGRTGYSIGMSYPPDWGERTMSLRPGDTTVFEPGMCFHFMPALWLDDGCMEITEPFRITQSGAECFCTTPRELVVKS